VIKFTSTYQNEEENAQKDAFLVILEKYISTEEFEGESPVLAPAVLLTEKTA